MVGVSKASYVVPILTLFPSLGLGSLLILLTEVFAQTALVDCLRSGPDRSRRPRRQAHRRWLATPGAP